MQIDEQYIIEQATNANAVKNGKALSAHGDFSNLSKTADDSLYFADCKGSGKNPYRTSIDFLDEKAPICRCSCPSRQFPCKHAIGLMFEILAKKEFKIAQLPDDIAQKRAKIAQKEAKKAANANNTEPKIIKKTNNAAKAKKIKKQLEGLDKAQLLVNELLLHGINTLNSTSVKHYKDLAKDFAGYYLIGVQNAFLALANEIENCNTDTINYSKSINILIVLNDVIQKSKQFLEHKLETKNYELESNELFEALGGIYKLEDLERLGSYKDNVNLVQLSFDISYDPVKKEYIDRAYYIDLADGQISQTLNYRPIKALSHIKADDTCFKLINVERLYYYFGGLNKRIRFNNFNLHNLTQNDYNQIISLANNELSTVVTSVKNEIKKILAKKYVAVLLKYEKLALVNDELVLFDHKQNNIILRNKLDDDSSHYSIGRLLSIVNSQLCVNQVMFGLIFYDENVNRLYLHPYSIITNNQIIRLQY